MFRKQSKGGIDKGQYDDVTDISESISETILNKRPLEYKEPHDNQNLSLSSDNLKIKNSKLHLDMSGDETLQENVKEIQEEVNFSAEEDSALLGKKEMEKDEENDVFPSSAKLSLRGDDEEDEEEQDDDDDMVLPEGSYKASDYDHLNVTPEVKELFGYITSYTPQYIEMEYKLRPFIPDYIPAVGDIDAFIKVSRPDENTSTLGLTVLDEPNAKQSDPTVLDLQLRAVAKHSNARTLIVKTVENAEKNTKIIEKWMRDISDLHRAKPAPTVHYSKQMPDIDSLMQEWPADVENLLREISSLPSSELEMTNLSQYVDLICCILDIPVYKSRVQSLHVLFTLFSVFKNSTHFRQLAEQNVMDNVRDDEFNQASL